MDRAHSDRERRAAIASETLEILRKGSYAAASGGRVDLAERLATSIRDSKLHLPEDFAALVASVEARPVRGVPAEMEFTSESTLEAIARLAARQESGEVVCLNFASARNPGGGFLGGSQAQEESLARSSTLVPTLERHPEMYRRNRTETSLLYLDTMIHSPGIAFFRNDNGALLERPAFAGVISAPAPNAKAIRDKRSPDAARVRDTLRDRARKILAVAMAHGADTLVLGAWGCGVFGNDPGEVADAFGAWLRPGAPYEARMGCVVFAVFDRAPGGPVLAKFRRGLGR